MKHLKPFHVGLGLASVFTGALAVSVFLGAYEGWSEIMVEETWWADGQPVYMVKSHFGRTYAVVTTMGNICKGSGYEVLGSFDTGAIFFSCKKLPLSKDTFTKHPLNKDIYPWPQKPEVMRDPL